MITFFAVIIILAAVGIVSWPLLKGTGSRNSAQMVEDSGVSELLAQKDNVLFAINELESDYETGSLSKNDYQELREKYEEKAVGLIKTVDEMKIELGIVETSPVDDEIEVEIARLRRARKTSGNRDSCSVCGAKIVADALFCSHCGTVLSAKCPSCSAKVKPEDLFCARCGMALSKRDKR